VYLLYRHIKMSLSKEIDKAIIDARLVDHNNHRIIDINQKLGNKGIIRNEFDNTQLVARTSGENPAMKLSALEFQDGGVTKYSVHIRSGGLSIVLEGPDKLHVAIMAGRFNIRQLEYMQEGFWQGAAQASTSSQTKPPAPPDESTDDASEGGRELPPRKKRRKGKRKPGRRVNSDFYANPRKCAVSGKGDRGKQGQMICASKHTPIFYQPNKIGVFCYCIYCSDDALYLKLKQGIDAAPIWDLRVAVTHRMQAKKPEKGDLAKFLWATLCPKPLSTFVDSLDIAGVRKGEIADIFGRYAARIPPCCLYGLRDICKQGPKSATLHKLTHAVARVPRMPQRPALFAMWFLLGELFGESTNEN